MVRTFLASIALLTTVPCLAQFPNETDRLMATTRLWSTVEYFHPYLAYRNIDWDQALVTAIPKIRAATNTAEYREAISGMLDELQDPETYVLPDNQGVVQMVGGGSAVNASTHPLSQVVWVHTASGSAFLTKVGKHYFTGSTIGQVNGSLGENAVLSGDLAELAQSGFIAISSNANHYQIESTEKLFIDFHDFKAVMRLSEPLTPVPIKRTPSGTVTITPEVPIPPAPIIRPPSTRYTDPYPPTEARLLAAIKTWGAIHYFFAYKDLVDEDWDQVFATYLPKFIEARDATDYNLTFADLLTHLTDTNTAPHSKTLDAYFGEVPVGLRIRLLDKYPIVTDVLDPAATEAGVHPGDVLKRIAAEGVTDRFRRFVQYIPASTPQRSGYDTVQRLTNGPAGTEVELAIENAQGEAHPVKLTRQNNPSSLQRTTDSVRILPGNIGYLDLDRLSETDAEAALLRLKDTRAIIFDLRGQALSAPAVVAHLAPATGTSSDTGTAAALITTPIALHPDIATDGIITQTASTFVVRALPTARQPLYKGKTLALIDERTIGESEYSALLLEASNKTEFVGVPTAGAESSIAELTVPGGITITYSTEDVRHGNGGKLQRLGIQPNISAPTTAKGLRAGKDEPLAAALSYLSK